MIGRWLLNRDGLIEELREQNRILREENKELYERIILMASSVPHIRIKGPDVQEILASSPMAIFDEDGNRIGNEGANVV
jgi:hypothetical protein